MTKKDYIMLARLMNDRRPGFYVSNPTKNQSDVEFNLIRFWQDMVSALADALATTNERFDRNRFLDACGY